MKPSKEDKQTLKVTLLLSYQVTSHIHLILEDLEAQPQEYYRINRWDEASLTWHKMTGDKARALEHDLNNANTICSFFIQANKATLMNEWVEYQESTCGCIVGNNCASTVAWFLEKFANIPRPTFYSSFSFNHVALGLIWWPSILPTPITLPGRVMDHTKHYLEAQRNAASLLTQSKATKYCAVGASFTLLALSVTAVIVSCGAASIPLISLYFMNIESLLGAASSTLASTYGFFKSANKLSAHLIAEKAQANKQPQLMA